MVPGRFDACEHARHVQKRKNEHRFDAQAQQRLRYETPGLATEVNRELAALQWDDLLTVDTHVKGMRCRPSAPSTLTRRTGPPSGRDKQLCAV
jgi:hypothetical protein